LGLKGFKSIATLLLVPVKSCHPVLGVCHGTELH